MTYSESAKGLTISHKRAMQELRDHGCEDYAEFYAELGHHEEYKASDVLAFLGY